MKGPKLLLNLALRAPTCKGGEGSEGKVRIGRGNVGNRKKGPKLMLNLDLMVSTSKGG